MIRVCGRGLGGQAQDSDPAVVDAGNIGACVQAYEDVYQPLAVGDVGFDLCVALGARSVDDRFGLLVLGDRAALLANVFYRFLFLWKEGGWGAG